VVNSAPKDPSFLSFEFGVTRLFGLGDIGTNGLVSGWAIPEDSHVWNNGPEAILTLETDVPSRAYTITVDGGPFITPRQPLQEITLYANGWRIGFWRFREGGAQVMVASIAPEQFFVRGDKALLNCVWHIPYSVRPSDLGLSGDGRELGFVFRSLTIA
jgi:hypothetical protein